VRASSDAASDADYEAVTSITSSITGSFYKKTRDPPKFGVSVLQVSDQGKWRSTSRKHEFVIGMTTLRITLPLDPRRLPVEVLRRLRFMKLGCRLTLAIPTLDSPT